jgi:hypothetical protein
MEEKKFKASENEKLVIGPKRVEWRLSHNKKLHLVLLR